MPGSEPAVLLYEVGPRDGLQNEPDTVPTVAKRELVDAPGAAPACAGSRSPPSSRRSGFRSSPTPMSWRRRCRVLPGVRYSALVPNERGYARFRAAGGVQVAATSSFRRARRTIAAT